MYVRLFCFASVLFGRVLGSSAWSAGPLTPPSEGAREEEESVSAVAFLRRGGRGPGHAALASVGSVIEARAAFVSENGGNIPKDVVIPRERAVEDDKSSLPSADGRSDAGGRQADNDEQSPTWNQRAVQTGTTAEVEDRTPEAGTSERVGGAGGKEAGEDARVAGPRFVGGGRRGSFGRREEDDAENVAEQVVAELAGREEGGYEGEKGIAEKSELGVPVREETGRLGMHDREPGFLIGNGGGMSEDGREDDADDITKDEDDGNTTTVRTASTISSHLSGRDLEFLQDETGLTSSRKQRRGLLPTIIWTNSTAYACRSSSLGWINLGAYYGGQYPIDDFNDSCEMLSGGRTITKEYCQPNALRSKLCGDGSRGSAGLLTRAYCRAFVKLNMLSFVSVEKCVEQSASTKCSIEGDGAFVLYSMFRLKHDFVTFPQNHGLRQQESTEDDGESEDNASGSFYVSPGSADGSQEELWKQTLHDAMLDELELGGLRQGQGFVVHEPDKVDMMHCEPYVTAGSPVASGSKEVRRKETNKRMTVVFVFVLVGFMVCWIKADKGKLERHRQHGRRPKQTGSLLMGTRRVVLKNGSHTACDVGGGSKKKKNLRLSRAPGTETKEILTQSFVDMESSKLRIFRSKNPEDDNRLFAVVEIGGASGLAKRRNSSSRSPSLRQIPAIGDVIEVPPTGRGENIPANSSGVGEAQAKTRIDWQAHSWMAGVDVTEARGDADNRDNHNHIPIKVDVLSRPPTRASRLRTNKDSTKKTCSELGVIIEEVDEEGQKEYRAGRNPNSTLRHVVNAANGSADGHMSMSSSSCRGEVTGVLEGRRP